jgi:hypothetical protein
MEKGKTNKPTHAEIEEYASAKQKLIDSAQYDVFPTPPEYEKFYEKYRALYGHSFPRCRVCYKPLAPRFPTDFEPHVDISKCTVTRYRDKCYLLTIGGVRKRCGGIAVLPDEVSGGDLYEMMDGRECLGPWGKCRDFKDSHSKSIILENFVFSLGVRKGKNFCSSQCKKRYQNQVYSRKYPEKKMVSTQRYIDSLVEDELMNRNRKQ